MSTHDTTVFVVTDIFPPMAAVGVYRTVALCRSLVEQGVIVKVITARHWDDERTHPEMLRLVPKEVQILRTASPHLLPSIARLVKLRRKATSTSHHASRQPPAGPAAVAPRNRLRVLSDWLSWWLHVPDSRIGWVPPAVATGLREARRSRPNAIYSTAPGWSSHVTGALLSYSMRVPFVADFRDPWCGSYWQRIPYAVHRCLDERLEGLVIGRASLITCAWDGIRRHLVSRYPDRADDIETILNGFDPEEADGIRAVRLETDRVVLLHAGTFYGPRSPEPLMMAFRQLRADSPDVAERFRIALLGRPYYGKRLLCEVARDYGVEDLVRVLPPVPRGEALALTKGADVALLFGQSGYPALASVPAKTFDYIGLGMRVLAIGAGEEACDVLRRGGCRVWSAASTDVPAIVAALRDIHARHHEGHGENGNSDSRLEFAWATAAARLAGKVHAVTQHADCHSIRQKVCRHC